MKKILLTILLVLFGFVAIAQDYNIKVNRISFFSYPSTICNSNTILLDSTKFNDTFICFVTVKIDLKNKVVVCGEVNGIKTKSTAFDIVSINYDNDLATLDIVGKNKTNVIRFELIDKMLVVSHQENDEIYGWFDRNTLLNKRL